MRYLPRLKLRDKLGLSFAALTSLIGLNAAVVIVTIFITSLGIDAQLNSAELLRGLSKINSSVGRYAQIPSRELANDIFVSIDSARQLAVQAVRNEGGVEALLPLIDDFRASFHKYVVEADQKASLKSHASAQLLGIKQGLRMLMTPGAGVSSVQDRLALSEFLLEILGQNALHQQSVNAGYVERARVRLSGLRQSALADDRSFQQRRDVYRLLHIAGDYLNTEEKLMVAEAVGQRTMAEFARLSERLEEVTSSIDREAQRLVMRQLFTAGAIMAGFFLLSVVGAMFLSRIVTREILRPILALIGTIRAIDEGNISQRAAIETRDEVGELAQAFNRMADGLQRSYATLEQQVVQRTRQLTESEQRFRDIVDTTDGIVWEANACDCTFTFVSKKAESMLGYPVADWYKPGFWFEHLHGDDRAWVMEYCAARIARAEPHRLEYRMMTRDGRRIWLQNIIAVVNEGGRPVWLRGIMLDVTAVKRSAEAFERVSHNYQMLFQEMLNGFSLHEIICDEAGTPIDYRFILVNPAFERMTGLSADYIAGKSARQVLPKLEPYWVEVYGRVALSGEPAFIENYSEDIDKYFEVMVYCPSPRQFACVFQDVTERKRAESTIKNLAFSDQLTGLPNRASLHERLSQALASAERNRSRLAVMVIDLDNFKAINDTLGHSAGDSLLALVAQRLSACVRHSDLVARLGGDEFVIILSEIEQPEDAAIVAGKIVEAVSDPYRLEAKELRTSPSIGICLYPDDSSDAEDLLKKADVAMYQAKAGGKRIFQFFHPDFQQAVVIRLALESELRQGLEESQFVLYYQPQYDLSEQRLCGVEALVRWRHPQRGLVMPSEFIPVAEETGLIVPLGQWILQEACRQMAGWHAQGLEGVQVSVNLSGAQFNDPALPRHVADAVLQAGLSAHYLNLEITETMAMASPETAEAVIRRIANSGPTFSIDDFGTGYSSLAYLKQFSIHGAKIDRSFVSGCESDANDADICEVSIMLAQRLGLQVLAEGVETVAQSEFLRQVGCEMIQGDLVSRPLPPELIPEFFRSFDFSALG